MEVQFLRGPIRRPAGALRSLFSVLRAALPTLPRRGSPASLESPVRLRIAFWHVADVPGVQGELLPAGAWGSAPHLFNLPIPLCPLWILVSFVENTLAVLPAAAGP